MVITDLFISQRSLDRKHQISGLIKAIENGVVLPKIIINENEDGSFQIEDGHHRLVSYWLSGRTELFSHEYLLVFRDRQRRKCGKILDINLFSKL